MNKLRVMLASVVLGFSLLLMGAVPALAASQSQIDNGLCTGANLQFTSNPTSGGCSGTNATQTINHIIRTIINLLSAVVGIVAVVMIIFGGFRYITSGGNDTSVTGAKNTLLYAIIGLIIVAMAQIMVKFVLNKVINS